MIVATALVYEHMVHAPRGSVRRPAYRLDDGRFYMAHPDDHRVRGLIGREVAIRFYPEDQFAHLACDHGTIERGQVYEHCVPCGAVRQRGTLRSGPGHWHICDACALPGVTRG